MSEEQNLNRIALRKPAVLAVLTVLLCLAFAPFNDGAPNFRTSISIGLLLAFACMVGIWCATSKGWIRFVASFVVLLIWGFLLNSTTRGHDILVMMIPLAIGAIISSTIELTKFTFGRFKSIDVSNSEFREGLRFKISHLLILTTAIAVLFAAGKACWPWLSEAFRQGGTLLNISTIIVVLSVNTLLSIWALLGQTVAWRLVVAVVLQIIVISLGRLAFDHLPLQLWATLVGLSTVATMLHLFLLRRAGLRFVRHE